MKHRIKAVIFDMDGVIVDTEPISRACVLGYLRQYNDTVTERDLEVLVGRGCRDAWEIIARLSGTGRDPQVMKDEYDRDWIPVHGAKVDYQAIFRPAVKDVLTYAKAQRLRTAVASSTGYQKVKMILTEVGIFGLMDAVVSGEDCARPKPNPDVYLEAARKLSLLPEECLVIEDSTVGIEAAHRAGAFVTALIDGRFSFDRRNADREIAAIDDVITILAGDLEKDGLSLD
ncbi:MAG: HAD family phosphatase [Candidatus Limiplasma sp.]|nr:HAD family phosphatase [Candidatus Limiplasma sp.]